MTYDLWYWDGIPGRGEFVRLALEAAGIAYRDRAREPGGDEALARDMKARDVHPPFAPPYLVTSEGMTIGQTANILLFLGERHGLAPQDPAGRLWVHQIQLTIADLVAEAHDVHHPIANSLYYEDQKKEAARRARHFREERIPKFMGWFERILVHEGLWLAGGDRWTYADLSLFQLIDGLRFAFPRRMATLAGQYPKVMRLHERVATLPELQAYLNSDRRLPYGDGIFRHYPELDAA
ncbi:glutathione S-transferase [Bordetella genomosp. 9]|uniref:glutathione S-transferase n=1 Tax=Bordetella genomosp. 9 TaxID=1416803 RepID=UPI000A290953|nr:glutathione S-transferase [Bordetella genomosp. 9]ARP89899.1 glutathione S-transferase [Bordetella genomosp. 9]